MTENNKLCPKVERSFEIIGKKWVAHIIHVLLHGPKRFNEIHETIPELSKRVLTERMRELEDMGIIIHHVMATERPVRAEYLLTEKGKELGRALIPLEQWAEKWIKHSELTQQ
ncbi:helix-turn-helix transcriptional regulator [Bacillaceae bacterium Marseille-Q3522]|nr:helix-turn-helix transcriptional regulator [Bacillaceae bacterium Marseille-Q3522]